MMLTAYRVSLIVTVFVIVSIISFYLSMPEKEGMQQQLHPALNQTTCGVKAFKRGTGQRVISFSFYEKDDTQRMQRINNVSTDPPDYFYGIDINLKLLPSFYPGWTVRIYHDLAKEDPLRKTLEDFMITYNYLDLCHIDDIPLSIFKGRQIGIQ